MKRIVFISVVIVFLACNYCFAEVCGWATYVIIPQPGSDCSDLTLEDNSYTGTLQAGCSVNESILDSCVVQHKICCPDTVRYYEVSSTSRLVQTSVPVGTEFDVAKTLCDQAEVNLIGADCASGFNKQIGIDGCAHYVKNNASDYSKTDLVVTAYGRVACSKFNNTSTAVLNPTASGGGVTAESLVELQAINTALTTIKTVLDSIPDSTNPLLTDIKTLLQTGLNFNSEALETGINQVAVNTNQVGVNTAAGNEILTAINNKLTQNCTTTWDPNGGTCTWYDYDRDGINETQVCTGANVTTCEGLDVSDSASLAKLQEIKDAIIAAGGGGTLTADLSETNLKIDETNSKLTDIKNLMGGSWVSSILSPFVDANLTADGYKSTTGGLTGSIPSLQDYKDEFSNFATLAKQSLLAQTIDGVFGGAPTTGASVVSFNGGVYGVHSFDFSSWSPYFSVIRGFCLILSVITCINIIVLKGR